MRRQSRHRPPNRGARGRAARCRRAMAAAAARAQRRVRSTAPSAAGRLHRLHRGVFARGPHGAQSARAAGWRRSLAPAATRCSATRPPPGPWELRRRGSGAIHVTVPSTAGRKRAPGIRVHRSRTLDAARRPPTRAASRSPRPPARSSTSPARSKAARSSTRSTSPTNAASSTSPNCPHRPIPPSLQAVLSLYTAGSTSTRSETGGALPRALRRPRHPAAERQHPHRRRRGRLRLAGRATHRRGRRLRLPPLAERLRARADREPPPRRRSLAPRGLARSPPA